MDFVKTCYTITHIDRNIGSIVMWEQNASYFICEKIELENKTNIQYHNLTQRVYPIGKELFWLQYCF